MVGRSVKSQAKAHQELIADVESRKHSAVVAYLQEQECAKEEGRWPDGLQVIAEQFGIGYCALGNHLNGGKPRWSGLKPIATYCTLKHTLSSTLLLVWLIGAFLLTMSSGYLHTGNQENPSANCQKICIKLDATFHY